MRSPLRYPVLDAMFIGWLVKKCCSVILYAILNNSGCYSDTLDQPNERRTLWRPTSAKPNSGATPPSVLRRVVPPPAPSVSGAGGPTVPLPRCRHPSPTASHAAYAATPPRCPPPPTAALDLLSIAS
jgi:hypothetical protein